MAWLASIIGIATYLLEPVQGNEEFSELFVGWSAEKIASKTRIFERRVARTVEYASGMAVAAEENHFSSFNLKASDVDFILVCTQYQDYFLPTTACQVQDRLSVPPSSGALDLNCCCSGYTYGLGFAKGLMETNQPERVLLITSEKYSKHIHPLNKSVRTIRGDGASANLLYMDSNKVQISPFSHGKDGREVANSIVPTGGMSEGPSEYIGIDMADDSVNVKSRNNIKMNGAEIFSITLETMLPAVNALSVRCGSI